MPRRGPHRRTDARHGRHRGHPAHRRRQRPSRLLVLTAFDLTWTSTPTPHCAPESVASSSRTPSRSPAATRSWSTPDPSPPGRLRPQAARTCPRPDSRRRPQGSLTHRTGARDPGRHRPGLGQRRDRRAAGVVGVHGEDPCRTSPGEERRQGPDPGRDPRLRPGLDPAQQPRLTPGRPDPGSCAARRKAPAAPQPLDPGVEADVAAVSRPRERNPPTGWAGSGSETPNGDPSTCTPFRDQRRS